MIDLNKLDINVKEEAQIILSKAHRLYNRPISCGEAMFAMARFSELPYATIQFNSKGACATWHFRGDFITTPTTSLENLPTLLLLQWLIFKEKVAEYEEAQRATSEVG